MINLIAKKIVDRVGVVKTSPVNRAETSQQIDPPKVGLTLTERLVLHRKLVKRKRTGMENREDTFEEDVAKNGVEVGMVKIRSKICDKFTFQIMSTDMVTLKKVIVIFKFTTILYGTLFLMRMISPKCNTNLCLNRHKNSKQ